MIDLSNIASPAARARIAAIPSLATFAHEIAEYTQSDPDTFWCCEAPFARLLASSFISDLATWELECLGNDPDHLPSQNGEENFEILRLGLTALGLHLLSPSPRILSLSFGSDTGYLYGLCEHNLIVNLGPGPVRLERWRHTGHGPYDVLDRSCPLEVVPTQLLAPGDRVRLEAHRDVARYTADEQPAVLVRLTRNRVTRLRWYYDATTLIPAGAAGADSSSARLEHACALLVALNHTAAAPAVAALCEHPDHFVRWSAVCRTMELDPVLGRDLVRRAVADSHPHVRRAAARSLERLEALQPVAGDEK
jgi:hypothetical protein